jgi:hypothetical protein
MKESIEVRVHAYYTSALHIRRHTGGMEAKFHSLDTSILGEHRGMKVKPFPF